MRQATTFSLAVPIEAPQQRRRGGFVVATRGIRRPRQIYSRPAQFAGEDNVATVGRFRSGHSHSGEPTALYDWRVTTGVPEVADNIFEVYGGEAPQSWETTQEDNLEVFTASRGRGHHR